MPKELNDEEYLIALGLEATLATAVFAFEQANATYQAFLGILRQRYDAPADAWKLEDWAVGFVPLHDCNESAAKQETSEEADGRPDD